MSIELNSRARSPRIWSTRQIWIASFFAGPFGGCYLLGQNYKALGNADYAKRCVMLGVVATCLLMFVSVYWDDFGKGYWKYFIALTYTNLIWEFAKRNQWNEIRELLASGVRRNSYWKLLFISVATLLSMFAFGGCIGAIQMLFE